MARALVSLSPSPLAPPLLFSPRNGRHQVRILPLYGPRRAAYTAVRLSFQPEIPPQLGIDVDIQGVIARAEGILYTLADAAVAAEPVAPGAPAAAAQKSGGWFGFISDAMEVVLKVLKDGLRAVHVPYAYGFAIILLTVIVKVATFPLTKKQSQHWQCKTFSRRSKPSKKDMQAIRMLPNIGYYTGLDWYQALSNVANEGLLTEGFFWIPSLGGPTTIAARQSGAGISWLIPFVDGHPPLGWSDTAAYLVLPVLLVISQYVSMEIMKPPQTDDPAQKNSLLVLKFLPLMIGYFSLSHQCLLIMSFRFCLGSQIMFSVRHNLRLRKLGGAKPVVNEDASGIISAGKAKRAASQPTRMGERFRQLKEEENKKRMPKAQPTEEGQTVGAASGSEDLSDDESNDKGDAKEEAFASSGNKQIQEYTGPRRK
ncbi:hypothetical protein Taro_007120 [Colocasia esculenta]|uniref:Uncharacterized protein n=1 Tax=Colocasia esculenta TaxID=4460 RepID=A0A843TZA6_COLES|nr:hypothetical protein [Colocasia esculenta]